MRWTSRIKAGGFAATLIGFAAAACAQGGAPLDRLRERDANARWEAASARHDTATPVQTPSPTPPQRLADRFQTASTQAPIEPYTPPPSRPVPSGTDPQLTGPDDPIPGATAELRKMSEILPFYDYEPDPDVRRIDPYTNICPRPEDAPYVADAPTCPDILAIPGGDQVYGGRAMPPSVYTWAASNIHYNPLYFEDVQLERYGHTYPCYLQPFDSAALFGLQLVGLPYQMTLDPICKCIYPLGYYRPGECAPKLHYQIPWNTRAAVNQAAVTTGLFYVIP